MSQPKLFLKVSLVATCVLLFLFFQNCKGPTRAPGSGFGTGEGTSSGNPTAIDTTVVDIQPVTGLAFLSICIDNLTLLQPKGFFEFDDSEVEIEIPSTLVELGGNGQTSDVTFEAPQGVFDAIVFEMEDSCETGHSIRFRNAQGTFQSSDDLDFTALGRIVLGPNSKLALNLQALADALADVGDASEIQDALESAGGEIESNRFNPFDDDFNPFRDRD